jgi:phosphatidylglycerophosphatase A
MSPMLTGARKSVATLAGAGLSPVMPGTCGSAVALLPCFFLPDPIYPWALAAGAVAATWGSVALARGLADEAAGGDPSWFVLDEAAGLWLAVLAPVRPAWSILLTAFVLFRIFDILKPPPLRRLERVGGGWGIVLDDLGAGVYAGALTWVAILLIG